MNATLSSQEIAGLLARRSLTPTAFSPFEAIRPDAQAQLTEAAHQAGMQELLLILSQPQKRARLFLPAPDSITIMSFYAFDGSWAMCWQDGETWQLGTGWTAENIVGVAARLLIPSDPPPLEQFSAELSPIALVALTAALDVMRDVLFRSLLNRSSEPMIPFTRQQLREQLEQGLNSADLRWVVTLFNMLTPPIIAEGNPLKEGVEQLLASGLITLTGDEWQPAVPLQRIATQWRSPLPTVALEVLANNGSASSQAEHTIAVRGDGMLHKIEFGSLLRNEGDTITLASVEANDLFKGLLQQLEEPRNIKRPASEPQMNLPQTLLEEPLPIPEEVRPVTNRFCMNCGNNLNNHAKFCTNCGHAVQAGT